MRILWHLLLVWSVITGIHGADKVVSNETMVHCLGTKKPLMFADPFPISEANLERFVSMIWRFYKWNGTAFAREGKTLLQCAFSAKAVQVKSDRFKKYQNWGLELPEVTVEDAGRYQAHLMTTGAYNSLYIRDIYVAERPTLSSEKLSVTREKKDGRWTLTCGTLASRGYPPLEVHWRAPNKSMLPGIYEDGNFTLTLAKGQPNWGFKCLIKSEQFALQCIPDGEKPMWELFFYSVDNIGPVEGGYVKTVLIVVACLIVLMVLGGIALLLYTQGAGCRLMSSRTRVIPGPSFRPYDRRFGRRKWDE